MFRPALAACFFATLIVGSFATAHEIDIVNQPAVEPAIPLPPIQVEAAEFANALADSLTGASTDSAYHPVPLVVISDSQSGSCCQPKRRQSRSPRQRGCRRGCR